MPKKSESKSKRKKSTQALLPMEEAEPKVSQSVAADHLPPMRILSPERDSTQQPHVYPDEADFERWFSQQQYAIGAIPNAAQKVEMCRAWCAARETLRNA